MASIFDNKSVEAFFTHILQPATTEEQAFSNTHQALLDVADDLHLGRVRMTLSAKPSLLRPNGAHIDKVIFDRGFIEDRPYSISFPTGDDGSAMTYYYPINGHTFSSEEIEKIDFYSKQIYIVFSKVITYGILSNIVITDLGAGIPNLTGFMQRIGMYIAKNRLESYSALYFNVKNFKYVNKSFAYIEGDKVMRKYAHMVQGQLSEDEMLARLGGDNYVALVRNENLEGLLAYIREMHLSHKTEEKSKEFVLGATVGVAELMDIHNPGEVMERISVAFQIAKAPNSKGIAYFNMDMYQKVMREKAISVKFHKGIKDREFIVYFQPKIDVKSKILCGAEALVRWNHKGRIIPPNDFIPVLEKDDSVCQLDFYVLDETCRMIKEWLEEGKRVVKVSVNFSRRHLKNPDLADHIIATIDRYGIDHKYIEVELTESEDYRDYLIMSKLVNDLRTSGVYISIDDFGTGYSSLNMLKSTHFDIVKIDKSFIPLEQDYPGKEKDMTMFFHIVQIAKELGMQTIAEGIETQTQLDYLKKAGCDMVQGFLFDRPMPAKDFEERLAHPQYEIKKDDQI